MNKGPMKDGCQILNENQGTLQYSDGWIFTTSDPQGLVHTLHFTNTTGSSVSLMFNASSIVVFGLVPPGPSPPLASYSIDGSLPVAVNLGATTECIPNQQLFSSKPLSGPGPHNLTIFVNQTSSEQPYILDYLWLCGGNSNSTASDDSGNDHKASHGQSSSTDGVIIGSVLGSVVLLLGIAFGVWFYIRRRRRRLQQLRRLHIASSPVTSWLFWNSRSSEKNTLFTSTEDIMADNPTTSSMSTRSRWDTSYRKEVPPLAEMPPPPGVRMSSVSKATSLSRSPSAVPPGIVEDLRGYPRRMSRTSSIAPVSSTLVHGSEDTSE
ncbi:hypothetical protein BD310DRAFT_947541 [Dichomitus squalens]|uniref:Uncharacterized protein n=1 Tax=Dichomitus squalens TaxID=114155 RepID=A0A4V2K8J6_9APHY|nr:hypothetical protein BD310DRAFT_947541 [Dichomitus squalens]